MTNLCFLLVLGLQAARVYDATSFGVVPGTEKDMSALVEQMLDKVKAEADGRGVTIRLAPGTYHFYPEGAVHKEYYISNHDQHSDRAVGIAIEGFDRLTLDGCGAEFIFHGRMLPVSVVGTTKCTLRNLSIDFAIPHIAQAEVVANDPEQGITFRVAPWVNARVTAEGAFEHYGEGWTMGSTMDGSPQANQGNIGTLQRTNNAIGSIAVFNDVIRDGLKGSVFQNTSKGYISGEGKANASKVRFGISGGSLSGFGWKVTDSMVINYMSAHDNHSLWDKLALSNGADSPEARAQMNRLGAAILMISRGTPFFQAGEEMLRSKDGDENSYKSSDAVNNIRWDTLIPDSEAYRTVEYYRGLIAMRRAYHVFRYGEVSFADLGEGRMEIRFGHSALAVINPTGDAFRYTLDGEWNLVADEAAAGAGVILREQGEVIVEPISIRIYVK